VWGFSFNGMKINILTKNIKLTPALKDFIEEKINPLEKFAKILHNREYYNHFLGRGKPRVEAWIEIGKETLHHKKGPFFWAECQMRFPGKSIRVRARSEDLKVAINEVKDESQRELKEYKEKIMAKEKRGARIFKKGI
jgi:ribosomal subunit interface protein